MSYKKYKFTPEELKLECCSSQVNALQAVRHVIALTAGIEEIEKISFNQHFFFRLIGHKEHRLLVADQTVITNASTFLGNLTGIDDSLADNQIRVTFKYEIPLTVSSGWIDPEDANPIILSDKKGVVFTAELTDA
jgi:hypothetical protein